MSDVYFVRPHYDYDSYKDLYHLIELSGYPLVYYEDIDVDSQNCYILTVLNGEINENGWGDAPRCQIIAFDLEWRLKESSYEWPESALTTPKGVSRVWAADRWYAERIGAQYVPLGSHEGLCGKADPLTCDIATLCYHSGRRPPVINALKEKGLLMAGNAWGDERDAILKGCHAVLHIHQHDRVHTVAPLRYALAAAYHKPLISESVYDRGIFEKAVLYADYAAMADYAALMVRRYEDDLRRKADELHELLCVRHSFKSYIERAL